jgi:hypothetical protein
MQSEDGRVTILESQFRRLAELFSESSQAVEVKQYGSVLIFNNGTSKLKVNADGNDIHHPDQENLW